ncbi:hypothetical protein Q1695_008844 [Nippostrongylus brasiliensis]|nr:hypothetical protein Q1695_008844 [Nippostrongylus brasiliensis]
MVDSVDELVSFLESASTNDRSAFQKRANVIFECRTCATLFRKADGFMRHVMRCDNSRGSDVDQESDRKAQYPASVAPTPPAARITRVVPLKKVVTNGVIPTPNIIMPVLQQSAVVKKPGVKLKLGRPPNSSKMNMIKIPTRKAAPVVPAASPLTVVANEATSETSSARPVKRAYKKREKKTVEDEVISKSPSKSMKLELAGEASDLGSEIRPSRARKTPNRRIILRNIPSRSLHVKHATLYIHRLPMTLIPPLVIVCTTFLVSYAYRATRNYTFNGNFYKETEEQPWFRFPHVPHYPIPVKFVNLTGFGKHNLPKDDVYVPHDWTDEEKQYLPCLNLTCVCPYFKGKVVGSECILPNGKPLRKAIRKEARMLSDAERLQIAAAFNRMKDAGIYDRIGFVHKYSGLHEGPGFFTWHREYLKRFELVLRRFLPEGSQLGVPYWDSTLDSELPDPRESIFFSSLFMGAANATGNIVDGPFAAWKVMEGTRPLLRFVPDSRNGELLNNARIDIVLEQKKVDQVLTASLPLETCKILIGDQRLLTYSHDFVHYYVSGDMKETYSSSSEPIFYFHHAMIDHIWEMWRQLRQTREQQENDYPPSLDDCYPSSHFSNASLKELEPCTNKDALSTDYTANMYEYEKRPSCSALMLDCGSRYLFCQLINDRHQCVSKLRFGANCEGFEHTPICFEGECIKGRCVGNDVKKAESKSFM